jgi:hypothetical protein
MFSRKKPDEKQILAQKRLARQTWKLEIFLIVIAVALTCLLAKADGFQVIVLNLFFLPVVMAGFFLGRYRAGILALFCVIAATVVIATDFDCFAAFKSPVTIALCVTIWGATLGLTTLLVGSLCDELQRKMIDAQEAHMGVVEVLSQYLQSANPNMQSRAKRVSLLSEKVAKTMGLSDSEIDNVRMASLLVDVENIEVTARVIRRAVGELDGEQLQSTFNGTDLVQSLGKVLSGVVPMLLEQYRGADWCDDVSYNEPNIGAEIIRSVRQFDQQISEPWSEYFDRPLDAVQDLRTDLDGHYHPAVLEALETVVISGRKQRQRSATPVA